MRTAGIHVAFVLGALIISAPAFAQSATVNLTLKGGRFHPAEVTAPAGRDLTIVVKNDDAVPMEFESNTMRVEKVVTPGATVTLHIRPLAAGRYRFFNDFNQRADGYVVVK